MTTAFTETVTAVAIFEYEIRSLFEYQIRPASRIKKQNNCLLIAFISMAFFFLFLSFFFLLSQSILTALLSQVILNVSFVRPKLLYVHRDRTNYRGQGAQDVHLDSTQLLTSQADCK